MRSQVKEPGAASVHCYSQIKLDVDPTGEESGPGGGSGAPRSTLRSKWLWTVFLVSTFLCMGYFLRHYIHRILVIVEHQNDVTIFVALICLYTVVSMPFAWGYLVINVATGYLYGFVKGLLVTIITATIGILIAFLVVRKFLAKWVRGWIIESNSIIRTLDQMLYHPPQAFKIIFLCRLTPIPFGLQNSLFSVNESLSTWLYCYATFLGLMPFQVLNVYLGSTLRSMEQVLYDTHTAQMSLAIFSAQVLVTVVVTYFVLKTAKSELDKAIHESENSDRISDHSDNPKPTDPLLSSILLETSLSDVVVTRAVS